MRRLLRAFPFLVSLCVVAGLSFVVAGRGQANDQPTKVGNLELLASVAAPTLIPGAQAGAVKRTDVHAIGAAVNTGFNASCNGTEPYAYAANNLALEVTLPAPAGATLWRVDVYGCATTATAQTWYVTDTTMNTGEEVIPLLGGTSSGPGIIRATINVPSGLPLAVGHAWHLSTAATSSNSGFIGAVYQYTLPMQQLIPITPVRVFDSRFAAFGGPIATGGYRLVNVKNSIDIDTGATLVTNAIPQGARAVAYNLTIVGTNGSGYVAILPGTTTTVSASSINWDTAGQTLANGGIISLGTGGAERQVTLVVGGTPGASTQVLLDITGYYM
jgi:hypothetical protein